MTALVLFAALLVLMALGLPLVAVLAAVSALGIWLMGSFPSMTAVQMAVFGMDKYIMLAIPLFILTGEMMNASGISKRLFDLATALVGHLRGGLAQVNILASLFMSGISGSSSADAALTSKTFLPIMVQRGYTPAFSGAVTATAAMLSAMLPPSIQLILYGSVTGASIGDLFLAAIIPGLILTGAMMLSVAIISVRRGYRSAQDRTSRAEKLASLKAALWALGLPAIVLFGLRFGIFTPTEAGAVAAAYSALVGLVVYRTVSLRDLPRILTAAATDTGIILLIVGLSAAFGFFVTVLQVPQNVAGLIVQAGGGATTFLLLTAVVVVVVGMFIEATALLLLAAPILAPIAMMLDINLVHFGIVLVLSIMLGTITPPFGQSSFIVSAITRIPVEGIFRETLFMLPLLLMTLLLLALFPGLFMWVLQLVGR